jgi:hypothetical protein
MTDTQLNEPVLHTAVRPKQRPWLIFLGLIIALPIGVMTLMWAYMETGHAQTPQKIMIEPQPMDVGETPQATSANQAFNDQNARTSTAQVGSTAPVFETGPGVDGPGPGVLGPGEVPYGVREVTYGVTVPHTDPTTGATSYRYETRTRYVREPNSASYGSSGPNPYLPNNANTTSTFTPSPYGPPAVVHRTMAAPVNHDPRVMQLVYELQRLEAGDADKEMIENKLAELRTQLEAEFSQMHERQAKEIEATSKRLDMLRETHEARGKNKDQIVQRRIDQLRGKSNPLDWNVNLPTANNAEPLSMPGFPQPYTQTRPIPGFPGQPVPAPALPSTFAPTPAAPTYDPRLDSPQTREERLPFEDSPQTTLPDTRLANDDLAPPLDMPPAKPNGGDSVSSPSKSSLANLHEIFAVIGSYSQARLAERGAEERLSRLQEMHTNGLTPASELQKAAIEYETVKQRVSLLKLQLDSIQRTLSHEAKAASDRLSAVNEASGSRLELLQAESADELAQETLARFAEALQLVQVEPTQKLKPTIEHPVEPESTPIPVPESELPKVEVEEQPADNTPAPLKP